MRIVLKLHSISICYVTDVVDVALEPLKQQEKPNVQPTFGRQNAIT